MARAVCLIRNSPHYRHQAFQQGLKRCGYQLVDQIHDIRPDDLLVIWNRYGYFHQEAKRFEKAGARVVIAENGYLGVGWNGGRWYAMALKFHNGAGTWNSHGPERWASFGVELAPWRRGGSELILLPQRGIGPNGVAMPKDWGRQMVGRLAGMKTRVRKHPGMNKCIPLETDLADARAVVTWGSGAALKALVMGIPVFYELPQWIGGPAGVHVDGADFKAPEYPDRLPMFERLAWAMWEVSEIESGEAFSCLLS